MLRFCAKTLPTFLHGQCCGLGSPPKAHMLRAVCQSAILGMGRITRKWESGEQLWFPGWAALDLWLSDCNVVSRPPVVMHPDVTGPKQRDSLVMGRNWSLRNVCCVCTHLRGFVLVMGTEECEGGFCPGDNAAATVARVIPPSFPPKCYCLTFKFTVPSSQLLCVEEDDGQWSFSPCPPVVLVVPWQPLFFYLETFYWNVADSREKLQTSQAIYQYIMVMWSLLTSYKNASVQKLCPSLEGFASRSLR